MASSSSTRRPTDSVYLSFYDQEIGKSFADHLSSAMKQRDINVLVDDEKVERGEDCSFGLSSVIQEFKCAVVIISKSYACSKRCLMEVTEIVQRSRETPLEVFPVFYDVSPSDVRMQQNKFAEAFEKHAIDPEIDEEETKKWRDALREVCKLAGWDVRNRQESDVIKGICEEIVDRFSRNSPNRMESGPERRRSVSERESGPERPRSVSETESGPERPRSVSEMESGPERPRSVSEEEMRRIQSYAETLRRLGDDARRLLYFTFTSFFFFPKIRNMTSSFPPYVTSEKPSCVLLDPPLPTQTGCATFTLVDTSYSSYTTHP